MVSLTPHRKRLLAVGLILVVGLGVRSCHLANHLAGPWAHPEEVSTSTDMYAFAEWAKRIAAGDWLCRDSYHPFMDWMGTIAPLEKFEEWWGGKEIYHQTPLYAYMLAVSYAVFDSNVPILVLQVLLSVLSAWLAFDLACQLWDAHAGYVAAVLTALFAPLIVLDTIQLRASFNSSFTLLTIWLLFRLRDRGTWGLALISGIASASGYLLRPNALVLMLLGPLVLLLESGSRASWRRWAPALLAGIVLAIAPFAIRNLIVGAPVLTFSTRGPETVIQANCKAADPGYMSTPGKDDYAAYMEAGHGSLSRALGAAIDTWPESSFSWWLWHQWQKITCVFCDYEHSNNINFYYSRRFTPLLEYLPTFGWFVGLGLVGVVLLGLRGRQRVASLVPLIALGGALLGCLLGFAMGRYRMPLAILMTIPAGATVSMIWGWIQEKRFVPAGIAAAAALALSVTSFTTAPVTVQFFKDGSVLMRSRSSRKLYAETQKRRPQEHYEAARVLHARGDTAAAAKLLEDYIEEYVAFLNREGNRLVALGRTKASLRSQEILLMVAEQHMRQVAYTYHQIGEKRRAAVTAGVADDLKKKLRQLRGR